MPSLLIGLSPRTDIWGAVTNNSYNGMLTSLGIVQMLIHCLGQRSMADKPLTSQCPSVSVADITDCATSPVDLPTLLLSVFFIIDWPTLLFFVIFVVDWPTLLFSVNFGIDWPTLPYLPNILFSVWVFCVLYV